MCPDKKAKNEFQYLWDSLNFSSHELSCLDVVVGTLTFFMIKEYISNNKDRFLSELFDWLRIPSISADRKYKDDIRKTAEVVQEVSKGAGVSS